MNYSLIARCVLTGALTAPVHSFAAETVAGAGTFSTLDVNDSRQSEESNVGSSSESFRTPMAVSTRKLNTNLQNLDATLRSMAGTYTQIDPFQGTVDVNIRSFSGLGRVNTMVDGVTQTFYGMAPTSYHSGSNSGSGVLIDPNFLAEVDVVRGNSSGSRGVNALAGSANLRTIGVDDLVKEGRQTGLLSRFSVGSNGLGRTGMIAVAGKTEEFGNGGSVGGLVGFSGSRIYATYKNGGGRSSADFIGEDNNYMRQNPQSQLYKLNINPDRYNKIELGGRNYTNTFTRRDLNSYDYYLRYAYTPLNELIDVQMQASTSRAKQAYQIESMYNFDNASIRNKSNAIDLSNTSRFSVAGVDTRFQLGGKLTDTDYSRSFSQENPTDRNAFSPAGTQKISALYTSLTLNKDIWQLDLNLNYTDSKVRGFKPACELDEYCFPMGESMLNLNHHAWNPSATLSAQVTPWLQPYVSYSHSSRAPNVQEAFFANEGGASMNPFLKPERAETWETGFNIVKQGLIAQDDSLHLKALVYQSRYKDYITSQSFFLCNSSSRCTSIDDADPGFNANVAINSLTPVTTKGAELELGYDVGVAYLNLTVTKQKANLPTSIMSTTQSFGYSDISQQPETFGQLDVGTRLLDRKLVVGLIAKYTGHSKRLSTEGIDVDSNTVPKEDNPTIPTIVDLYSSYEVNDNLKLKLGVQNLANKNYAEALNRMNQDLSTSEDNVSINTTARGRTWVFGGEVRF